MATGLEPSATTLRRSADTAHLALSHPHEALIFIYRGLEWLKRGTGVGWDQIATDIGVPLSALKGSQEDRESGDGGPTRILYRDAPALTPQGIRPEAGIPGERRRDSLHVGCTSRPTDPALVAPLAGKQGGFPLLFS